MTGARQKLMARSIEEFTDSQIGFLSLEHVHFSILTFRRCLQTVNLVDTKERIGRCERPAVMRKPIAMGESLFACDICSDLFGWVNLEEGGLERPHAAIIRRYNRLSCDRQALDATSPAEAVALAFDLVAALPPCPTPTAIDRICPRCFVIVTHPGAIRELDGWLERIKVDAERRWPGVSSGV